MLSDEAAFPGGPPVSLHPLLASRWSPARFDPSHIISAAHVQSLIEAARWAPSAGNSQPWSFVVGRRGDPTHERLVRHLAPSSRRWALGASLLLANLAHRYVAETTWEYSEFALYDLGQAVAHMTLQARALGLQARQFRAFSQAGLATEFAVPAHWEVISMSAVGRAAEDATPAEPIPARQRRTHDDLIWTPLTRGPAPKPG